jgi:hypothetical protein
MGTGSLKDDFITGGFVNEEPVGLDVTFSTTAIAANKLMIPL